MAAPLDAKFPDLLYPEQDMKFEEIFHLIKTNHHFSLFLMIMQNHKKMHYS